MPRKTGVRCYFGCEVDGPIHCFPHFNYPHEKRFNAWKDVLSLKTQEDGNEYIRNNIKLCDRHFKNCYKLPRNRLTANAVPTLHLYQKNYNKQKQSSNNLQQWLEELPVHTSRNAYARFIYQEANIQIPSTSELAEIFQTPQIENQTNIQTDDPEPATANHLLNLNEPETSTSNLTGPLQQNNTEINIQQKYFKAKLRNAKLEQRYIINKNMMEVNKYKLDMKILKLELRKLKSSNIID